MAKLEDMLQLTFNGFGISPPNQDSIRNKLSELKEKHEETYNHSVRVALLGARVARFMHLDPKVLIFSGALHDIGKIKIKKELLEKTEKFTESDMKEMRKHVMYGYNMLKGVHDYTAKVISEHHQNQEHGYPKKLPKTTIPFSHGSRVMIKVYGRMLSLIDFYDSITTRVNERFGEKRKLTPEEAKSILLMQNPDQKQLIEEFYDNRIFGEEEEVEIKDKNMQDGLYEALWLGWEGKRNPKEIRRHVVIASALEPLSEKVGCTTRSRDISPYLKLEYFIVGAANIGDAFEDLAERIIKGGKQPSLIYDLAYKAQADCKKNRGGGRINQGIIEMLTPIVAAQALHDTQYKLSVDETLEKAKEVLQSTSREDVDALVKMKDLARQMCEYYEREIPQHEGAQNVYDYYAIDLQTSTNPTSINHNLEFVAGFPSIRQMYHSIMQSERKEFNRKVEDAYAEVRQGMHHEASVGLTADCIATAIYLCLSHNPKEKIVI